MHLAFSSSVSMNNIFVLKYFSSTFQFYLIFILSGSLELKLKFFSN